MIDKGIKLNTRDRDMFGIHKINFIITDIYIFE